MRRAEAPRHGRALEGAIRGAEPHGIARRENERGQGGQLVSRHDGDIAALDDASTALQYVHGAPRECACRRRNGDTWWRADPDGEMTHIVPGQLVRLELDRAGNPPALWRRGADHDLLARRSGTAHDRAAAERNSIGR